MAAIDFPASPTNGQTLTSGDKTWVYSTSVGAWNLQTQTVTGPTGPAGIAIQGTAPASTSVLWADTSVTGTAVIPQGGSSGQLLSKIDATDYNTQWITAPETGTSAQKGNNMMVYTMMSMEF